MLTASLEWSKTPLLKYNTKLFDNEAPGLELWAMWNTFSLALLPGPL